MNLRQKHCCTDTHDGIIISFVTVQVATYLLYKKKPVATAEITCVYHHRGKDKKLYSNSGNSSGTYACLNLCAKRIVGLRNHFNTCEVDPIAKLRHGLTIFLHSRLFVSLFPPSILLSFHSMFKK